MLSEPGLYFFLGRSDKPGALPFQKWLAGEVIPAIRKTGCYAMDPRPPHAAQGAHVACPPQDAPSFSVRTGFALPGDLPQSALALKPSLRQRLWRDALDTVRLEGGDTAMAVVWFDKLCRMMACAQAVPAGCSPLVSAFFDECCVSAPGARIRSSRLYEAMRRWLRLKNGHAKDMIGMKAFGESMRCLARLVRSNGSYYQDIALR